MISTSLGTIPAASSGSAMLHVADPSPRVIMPAAGRVRIALRLDHVDAHLMRKDRDLTAGQRGSHAQDLHGRVIDLGLEVVDRDRHRAGLVAPADDERPAPADVDAHPARTTPYPTRESITWRRSVTRRCSLVAAVEAAEAIDLVGRGRAVEVRRPAA